MLVTMNSGLMHHKQRPSQGILCIIISTKTFPGSGNVEVFQVFAAKGNRCHLQPRQSDDKLKLVVHTLQQRHAPS